MERLDDARSAILDGLQGFGEGELAEALLDLEADEIIELLTDTNSLRLVSSI